MIVGKVDFFDCGEFIVMINDFNMCMMVNVVVDIVSLFNLGYFVLCIDVIFVDILKE